ncbi:hypothetical protein L204_105137 [Cryptococcus depauperatus]|nr:hypothetical protein L204_03787 [Cryptococcus depauperatus CBS 7855]
MDALEKAALDGSLFADPTPPSPTRSISSVSPVNTDDELGSDLESFALEDDSNQRSKALADEGFIGGKRNIVQSSGQDIGQQYLNHNGPQTGVKGVIEDHRTAVAHQNAAKRAEAVAQSVELERKAIVGLTVHEEAELVAKEKDADEELQKLRRKRIEQLRLEREGQVGSSLSNEEGSQDVMSGDDDIKWGVRKGALREIGKEQFVEAVERKGWVVVLIYEPGLPRCDTLFASLLHLSLNLPIGLSISLNRARASALDFSLLPPKSSSSFTYEGGAEEELDENGLPKCQPDPDVLPAILAYKDGELEKKWIRVDWDIREDGVEGLLQREGILPPSQTSLNTHSYIGGEEYDD